MAALTPAVARPALAAPTSDGVDAAALSFLVAQSLAQKEKEKKKEKQAKVKKNEEEKEERRMKRINEMVRVELPVTHEEREPWRRSPPHHRPPQGRGEKGRRGGRSDFLVLLALYVLLGSTVDTCSCLGPGRFLGRIPHSFYVVVVLTLYALGNLDFLRATGTWRPLVRCLFRRRSTGKFGVFWEITTRNYFYGPLYLAVTCAVYSTTLCF